MIDQARLRQIMLNLVGNAYKFTNSGHIKITLQTESIDAKLSIIFSVEDTGVGIEKDQLEKIFDAFEQKEEFRMTKLGGLGLGLTITKRLVEIMDGEIHVESEVGKGSVFSITFRDVKEAI